MSSRPHPLGRAVQTPAAASAPPLPTYTWAQRQADLKKAKDQGYIEGFCVKGLALSAVGCYCGALACWLITSSGVFR